MTACEGSPPRLGITILLVEDDQPTLELLSLYLGRLYRIKAFSSGEEALHALCTDDDITVILTDLRMPGMNGYDILRFAAGHTQRAGRMIPAIVLTGHGTPEDERQARSIGVTHFQRKPIDLRQLRQAIEMCSKTISAPNLGRATTG